jgi:hypothetical protein
MQSRTDVLRIQSVGHDGRLHMNFNNVTGSDGWELKAVVAVALSFLSLTGVLLTQLS